METTIFLASLWGPVMFVAGLGLIISRRYYLTVYKNANRDRMAVVAISIIAMTTGLAQVQFHNVWESLPQIIISLLGWAMLIEGALYTLKPKIAEKLSALIVEEKMMVASGVICLILGGYLSWVAFMV